MSENGNEDNNNKCGPSSSCCETTVVLSELLGGSINEYEQIIGESETSAQDDD